jgi:poly-gamma-glutamate synthesis protein (capsule biosynthesis protein)
MSKYTIIEIYRKKMKLSPILVIFFASFLSACGPSYDYVMIRSGDEYQQEEAFLESFFDSEEIAALNLRAFKQDEPLADAQEAPLTSAQKPASIFIDFISSWEHENSGEDSLSEILVSRTVLVPKEDPLTARTNTTLEACLDGTETIVKVNEIAPPFVALRVDGLAVDEEDYPLVRLTSLVISTEEGKKVSKRLEEKINKLKNALEEADKPLVEPAPQLFWIASGGDTMLDRGASDILLKEGPAGIFGGTAQMLADCDLSLINLEGVVSRRGTKVQKSFNFRFVPEIAPALRAAGIDAVLHANNHVFDFGETAFIDSLSYLEQAEIGVTGAGKNIEEASRPYVFKKGDLTCHVYGVASFPRERNGWDGVTAAALAEKAGMLHTGRGGREKLKERFSSYDKDIFNVVLFHGGVEWSRSPDAATRELYTDLIASGADLLIGSHPHIVQGFEWVNGKPVFWSLGNYVFGGMGNTEGGEEGLFIRLGFSGKQLLYLEPFALTLTHTRTNIAPPEKLSTFYNRSKQLKDQK